MRGTDERAGTLFSYVDLEARVRTDHPLRVIRVIANEVQAALAANFSTLHSRIGRPSIAPERLLWAMLLQAFYSVRSERQLMERLDTYLLFRWFVGLGCKSAPRVTPPASDTSMSYRADRRPDPAPIHRSTDGRASLKKPEDQIIDLAA
jgi:transposase